MLNYLIFSFLLCHCLFAVAFPQYEDSEETFESPDNPANDLDIPQALPTTTRATTTSTAAPTPTPTPAPTTAPTTAPVIPPIVTNVTISPGHVQGQVDKILTNVNNFNISGIVDQALGIRNDVPVRNLVNAIIGSVFCNTFLVDLFNCLPAQAQQTAKSESLGSPSSPVAEVK